MLSWSGVRRLDPPLRAFVTSWFNHFRPVASRAAARKPMGMSVEHTITIRVRYPEVDAMGYLHHSRYLQYFEMGRVELLRSLGHSYADLERRRRVLRRGEGRVQVQGARRATTRS